MINPAEAMLRALRPDDVWVILRALRAAKQTHDHMQSILPGITAGPFVGQTVELERRLYEAARHLPPFIPTMTGSISVPGGAA